MAVAHDGNASGTTVTEAASPITFSHTCGAGSDRGLVVGLAWNASAGMAITGVTYNGVAMTHTGATGTDGTNRRSTQYALANPASGANTVSVAFTGTASLIGFGGSSYTGVDQTTPIRAGTPNSGGNTTGNPSIAITSQTDDMVVDMGHFSAISAAVGAGQTQRFQVAAGDRACASDEPGASSVTMSWTLTAGGPWAICGFSLAAAGGGGGGDTNARLFGGDLFNGGLLFGRLVQ